MLKFLVNGAPHPFKANFRIQTTEASSKQWKANRTQRQAQLKPLSASQLKNIVHRLCNSQRVYRKLICTVDGAPDSGMINTAHITLLKLAGRSWCNRSLLYWQPKTPMLPHPFIQLFANYII